MSTFHTTFSVVLNETGKTLSSATPPGKPRKLGQLSSANEAEPNTKYRIIAQHILRYISIPFRKQMCQQDHFPSQYTVEIGIFSNHTKLTFLIHTIKKHNCCIMIYDIGRFAIKVKKVVCLALDYGFTFECNLCRRVGAADARASYSPRHR